MHDTLLVCLSIRLKNVTHNDLTGTNIISFFRALPNSQSSVNFLNFERDTVSNFYRWKTNTEKEQSR
jgi:hypothetical protein